MEAGEKDNWRIQIHRMSKKQATAHQAPDITRSLPFSVEGERAILSCFLWNPSELLPDAKQTIPEEAFYHSANRLLFQVFLEHLKWNKPVEYITLSQHLQDKGLMDKIGGQGVLAELLDFVPTPAHYGYYKRILIDKYLLRQGIGHCMESINTAYEYQEGGLDEWTRQIAANGLAIRQQFVQGSSALDGHDLAVTHDEMVEVMYQKGPSTGFPWMDKLLGGLLETALVLIQGRRAIGKSSLARQIAWHAVNMPEPITTEIFTVEMTRTQYYQGITCLEGVDSNSHLQKTYQKHEIEIMEALRKRGKTLPLKLHDNVRTLDETISRMETAHLKRKARLYIVDMPQRLSGEKKDGRERELSGIFWAMKDFAKRTNSTVITPVHLNSAMIARGSEDIENHADQIIMLGANKEKPGPLDHWSKKILAKCSKNRFGPEGACLFYLIGKHFRFEEVEECNELDIEPAEESKPKRGR